MTVDERRAWHQAEAVRIQHELDGLDPARFAEDGPVRWVLRQRIIQEQQRAQENP